MQAGDLNPRQRAFIEEYIKDLNGTQAAIRAGYSSRGADVQAHRLLSDARIQAAVAEAKAARSERTEISADAVLRELASIAFAHMGQYATWYDDRVSLKDSGEVDPRAVAEVRQTSTRNGINVSIKLHDKIAALTKLGDHLGLWKKEPALEGDGLDIVIERRGEA